MARRCASTAVLIGGVLALAAPATAGAANETSAARCDLTIDRQTAKGIQAGGGPKAGIDAPTNCDHFFQSQGLIGKPAPPGQS